MIKGLMTALITPFKDNGSIDFSDLQQLVEWQIDAKVDGLVLAGTTGEGSQLEKDEFYELVEFTASIIRKRVPLIVSSGSSSTKQAVEKTEIAKKFGADGVLVITPYYLRPNVEGCLKHYEEVASVDVPIILYHNPKRTNLTLSLDTLLKMEQIPQVVGIKECSGDMDFLLKLKHSWKKAIYCGDDILALPMLASGCSGLISSGANVIPSVWKEMVHRFLEQDLKRASQIFWNYYPLLSALLKDVNPQGIKYAVSQLGKCKAVFRLPLVRPPTSVKNAIEKELATLKLLKEMQLQA